MAKATQLTAEEQQEFLKAAQQAGVADPRNTVGYVKRAIARVRWLQASATERERRRKERLEASPARLALLKRAAEKRRRKGARRAAEAYRL